MPRVARRHLIRVISHAGCCQRNTKRVSRGERQNQTSPAKGPLSAGVLYFFLETCYLPEFPETLAITEIGVAQIKQKGISELGQTVLLATLHRQFSFFLGCVFYTPWYTKYILSYAKSFLSTLQECEKKTCKALRLEGSDDRRIHGPRFLNS